jgi:putative Holliday junction resolvase
MAEAGKTASPQLVLAFDYGMRRIGIASGDTLTRTARALTTLDRHDGALWSAIERLVREYQPAQLVVGLPHHMDGTSTPMTDACRAFAIELRNRFDKPVALVDERLSSREAEGQLRDARASGLKRRRTTHEDVDMTAARIVLERWLESPQQAEKIGEADSG